MPTTSIAIAEEGLQDRRAPPALTVLPDATVTVLPGGDGAGRLVRVVVVAVVAVVAVVEMVAVVAVVVVVMLRHPA